ncbi:GMC family oxidoreductase [Brenneria izbisi]|uniref:GMC family oxidoreductase N-terminal domain-containing protein n=1 Tax=Brenneria izbisi TaxID=2939450 RepID=A0AA42C5N9_9GAMM|nr:GMC family oxidoreductase N-terminal domain-containing protein [Brenneria izbisi]MCV9879429.1 GMC family oxidoreductase N-terminal domain-containing protein [Brenneria izbisi]MCV9882629.1 GMC family oxidoreductase N-terminal domain-containing protein [Brenneria izbisi]
MSGKNDYDVIVVGGGAAGCVVAGKLATKTDLKILLLEAGDDDNDMLIHIPAGFAKLLQQDKHVWPYNTIPQVQLTNEPKRYRSAKVIGGGSSINAMCYVRGQARDYQQWQEAVGDEGKWSWQAILPHFIAQEGNDTFHNEYHGTFGPLKVSLAKNINKLNQGCLRAFQEYGLPYNPDYNGKTQLGVSPVQGNFSDARRCSAAVAYLNPVRGNANLEIKTRCPVSRILIEKGVATGVEFKEGGQLRQVRAGHVILSGGAIHSPKILMHSGVGPAEHLTALGIPVLVDSPDVGKNLQDHPIVPVKAYCKGELGYQKAAQGIGALKSGLKYLISKDGPAAGNGVETVSYFNPDDLTAEPTIQCYHVPIISEDGLSPSGNQSGITFELVVLRPKSRGEIMLRDTNPFSEPLINPNFMADEYDLTTAIKSVKAMREVMNQPSLAAYLESEIAPGPQIQTDEQIGAWIKQTVTTMWHPVGTCRMGKDEKAVVDARLRVKGVENLRIIDASIMPNIISGNTNAPTQALANYGVEMFIEDLKH